MALFYKANASHTNTTTIGASLLRTQRLYLKGRTVHFLQVGTTGRKGTLILTHRINLSLIKKKLSHRPQTKKRTETSPYVPFKNVPLSLVTSHPSPSKTIIMILIVSPFFMRWFVAGYASAITLYPFVILKHERLKKDKVLINHERIHLKQQIELLIVGFYIWYMLEYLYRYYQHRSQYRAYRNISFEREAFDNELDLDYLETRKLWAFRDKQYWGKRKR